MKTLALLAATVAATVLSACTIVPARPIAYYPPAPVYAAPAVVIAAPPLVTYGPAPRVVYPPRPYFGYGGFRYRRFH